jgi:hypothetical protein
MKQSDPESDKGEVETIGVIERKTKQTSGQTVHEVSPVLFAKNPCHE